MKTFESITHRSQETIERLTFLARGDRFRCAHGEEASGIGRKRETGDRIRAAAVRVSRTGALEEGRNFGDPKKWIGGNAGMAHHRGHGGHR